MFWLLQIENIGFVVGHCDQLFLFKDGIVSEFCIDAARPKDQMTRPQDYKNKLMPFIPKISGGHGDT